MNSKKRKHIIEDSDEGEEEVKTVKKNNKNTLEKSRNNSDTKKSKKKRIIVSDDDEDENSLKHGDNDNNSSISINDIKKQASKRAKNLSKSIDTKEDLKPSSQSNKKSPACSQKNTVLNYFKKASSSSSLDKSFEENKKNTTPVKAKVSDDFMTTTIIKDDVIIKKQKTKHVDSPDSKAKLTPTKGKKDLVKASIKMNKQTTEIKENVEEVKLEVNKTKKITKMLTKDKNEVEVKVKQEEPKILKDSIKGSKVNKTPKKDSAKSPINKTKKKQVSSDSEDEFSKTIVPDLSKKTKSPLKKKEPIASSKKPLKTTPVKPALPRIEEPKRISQLWVDKYKPTNVKNVIGMHGDRSPLKKLLAWLKDWHLNFNQKPAFSKFGDSNGDGAGFKAALLSGPPGIGKTTSAQLACKELGFDYLEMNASDKRSKKSIKEDVKELLANTKLTSFFTSSSTSDQNKLTARHCLIMDEVDGMAGNEDRGGVAELIQLIKGTKIPIICICNDRSHPKIRSLVNYCFDLRFPKPKIANIRGPLRSICFNEKIEISPKVIDDLIVSTNYDIRQCIGNLAIITAGQKNVTSMVNQNERAIKDVKLGPFDAIRKVFATGADYSMMSFSDKSDLFFADYSIMPLFVFENYPQVNVETKESSVAKQLKRMSRTIDAISMGDIVEREVRSNQNWSLLPLQAAFSTVMPGSYMRSQSGLGFPQFPQYMGKISTTNKNIRLADELVSHMTLSISGTRTSFVLDYLESMKNSLAKPLEVDGVEAIPKILEIMENYSITSENMNSLFELSLWNGETDPLKNVNSKVKRALTMAYNKKGFALPYSGDCDIKKLEKRGNGSKGKGKALAFSVKDSNNSDEEALPDDEDDVDEIAGDYF